MISYEFNSDWPYPIRVEHHNGVPMVYTGRKVATDECFYCERADEVEEMLSIPEAIQEGVLKYVHSVGRAPATCDFNKAWVGPCKQEATTNVQGHPRCDQHSDRECSKLRCKNIATYDCESTIGGFTCGRLWCSQHKCGGH